MPHESRPPLVILAGPTATGKTDVGAAWAEQIDGEIISADSVQVYRYMDIGTAKPPAELRRRLPHHLVDIVDPDEPFSVADFERQARIAIRDIRRRGKVPLLVGGTGLYIRAVTHGLFDGSAGDPGLRKRFREQATVQGTQELHGSLREIDPEAAQRIHPHDLFRIIRALEVFHLTGIPISQHQQRHGFAQSRYRTLYLALTIDRDLLYERIGIRVDRMLAQGLVEEVEHLIERGYDLELPAMKSIGYRHIGSYLKGTLTVDDALREMKRDTRHYARRQMTWFRALPGIRWLTPDGASKSLEDVRGFLEENP